MTTIMGVALKSFKVGAEKVAQLLRACASLLEDLRSTPSTRIRQLTTALTPASGGPIPSSDLYTGTCIIKKSNKNFKRVLN